MATLEREIKLGAWAGLVLPDLNGVVDGATATALAPQRLTATYYDSADLRLARWGVTVRHRVAHVATPPAATARAARAEPEDPWTVKLPAGDAPSSVLSRREVGFPGAGTRMPVAVGDLVAGLLRGAPLVAVARLRTDRFRWRIADGEGKPLAELDDDEVSVLVSGPDGRGRRLAARFRELEVELAEGADPAVIEAVAALLQGAGAGAADPTPKVVRALGPAALEPPDVVVPAVASNATAGEAITAAIAASVERLFRHDPGVRLGEDPEAVHQARVATRRLRSDLRTFGSLLDEAWTQPLRDELGWLAALLGDVRDTDVLLARLEDHVRVLPAGDQAGGRAIVAKLHGHRGDARAALLEAMTGARYVALVDALIDAASAPRFRQPVSPQTCPENGSEASRFAEVENQAAAALPDVDSAAPAADVLPALVRRPWRHLARAVDDLGDAPTDDALHGVRIRAKRCRYAAEAVAPVIGKNARSLAAAVADVQSVLGDFHDAIVAEAWLRATARRAPAAQALVAGQLVAAERRLAAEARSAWSGKWKKASAKKLRSWLT